MCKKQLIDKIVLFQFENKDYFNDIIDYFDEYIKYLAYKLNYAETYTDLIIFLFKLISKICVKNFDDDIKLKSYLKRCLKNDIAAIDQNLKTKNN